MYLHFTLLQTDCITTSRLEEFDKRNYWQVYENRIMEKILMEEKILC